MMIYSGFFTGKVSVIDLLKADKIIANNAANIFILNLTTKLKFNIHVCKCKSILFTLFLLYKNTFNYPIENINNKHL